MSILRLCAFVYALTPTLLSAQALGGSDEVMRVGPGVRPPRVLRKMEPKYSPSARADHVQGTVVFQMVVNEKGRPTDIAVISPLGFGLDEQAQAAIETWEFAPGTKDGRPVKILATVEVNFRFPDLWFDEKAEHRRTSFNVDLETLKKPRASAAAVDRAVKSMQDLCQQRFPPAMYVVGIWEISGDYVTKDPEDGLALIEKAAAKNYGPALYEIGLRQIQGQDLPKDIEKGLQQMREAAVLGSTPAQLYLGSRYAKGDGVPPDENRARRYYRLCAAQGVPTCQYRLGRILFDEPGRPERDYIQAVAWIELASKQGLQEAKDFAAKECASLTESQVKWVNDLKPQLVRR